jgi:hypothetical protein
VDIGGLAPCSQWIGSVVAQCFPGYLGMAVVISPPNLQSLRARAPVQEPHGTISASFDRRSEDVRVLPIIIAELELGNMGKANGSDEITLCQQTREASITASPPFQLGPGILSRHNMGCHWGVWEGKNGQPPMAILLRTETWSRTPSACISAQESFLHRILEGEGAGTSKLLMLEHLCRVGTAGFDHSK